MYNYVLMSVLFCSFLHVQASETSTSNDILSRPSGIASADSQESNSQMKAWWDKILALDNQAYQAYLAGDEAQQKEFQQQARRLREQLYDAREWQEQEYKKRLAQAKKSAQARRRKTM